MPAGIRRGNTTWKTDVATGARERVELKEVFVFFFEGPKKEGKPVLVKDLPLECHNPPVKAAARSCGCLPTMEVV
jgi:hypothetical protein